MADTAVSLLPLPPRSMPLLDHLEELRKRIIYSVLGVLVGFGLCWSFADRIFGLMQQPILQALRHHGIAGGLVYLNPTDPFNLYLDVALVGGLFAASPFVFYQLWLFIAPGLYRKERHYVLPFLLSTVGLFIAGGLFGYKMVYPASLDFLIGYGRQFQPMITIGEYTRLFVTIVVGLGLIFEMPVLVFFLAVMRLITAQWMWRNLRYSILVIFIVAAIVTPTADILNMCLFAAPMVTLYAISMGVAWMVNSARKRRTGAA
ncbi:MAG TPA: twin-arginine translocase subunit TatC [Chthoniobacterales bacterium]|jgi:sec-independent protein translocase protein TatC|nr:twin-arginine translocase subunit TatC [Chthoniobacterales bacterium]